MGTQIMNNTNRFYVNRHLHGSVICWWSTQRYSGHYLQWTWTECWRNNRPILGIHFHCSRSWTIILGQTVLYIRGLVSDRLLIILVYSPADNLKNGRFHQHLRDTFAPLVVRYVDLMESSIAQSIHKGFEKERWEIKG